MKLQDYLFVRWVNAFDFPLCKKGDRGGFSRERKLLETNSQIEPTNNPKSDSEEEVKDEQLQSD
jgi:hypothetical protein